MATRTATKARPKATPQMSREQIATDTANRFISLLKEGTVPWRKGWTCAGIMPANLHSKRPYRGFNSLWLGLIQQAHGYQSPYWTTYRAAKNAGGTIKPGEYEKSTYIILWKWLTVEDKKNPGEVRKVPMLRTWNVFNSDQWDGLDVTIPEQAHREPSGIIPWIQSTYDGPTLRREAGDRAYYWPRKDEIVLPLPGQFLSDVAEAETAAHEYIHSTGHPDRLARMDFGWTEQQDYAKEELVAEIGAAMLMQQYGIEPDMPSMAGYVKGWLRALQDDHSLIISAAQAAQKGVDLITGYTYQEDKEEE